eukprot:comp22504_c0_seq1/m.56181 comp22504_c0_seq1/g.56181  ORF comp22504_c0_seq1/g.56181 comp22504_c0_seq1/m.56181 type:complete len:506 (+) comp22504_c0_seq1:3120-4637(+)
MRGRERRTHIPCLALLSDLVVFIRVLGLVVFAAAAAGLWCSRRIEITRLLGEDAAAQDVAHDLERPRDFLAAVLGAELPRVGADVLHIRQNRGQISVENALCGLELFCGRDVPFDLDSLCRAGNDAGSVPGEEVRVAPLRRAPCLWVDAAVIDRIALCESTKQSAEHLCCGLVDLAVLVRESKVDGGKNRGLVDNVGLARKTNERSEDVQIPECAFLGNGSKIGESRGDCRDHALEGFCGCGHADCRAPAAKDLGGGQRRVGDHKVEDHGDHGVVVCHLREEHAARERDHCVDEMDHLVDHGAGTAESGALGDFDMLKELQGAGDDLRTPLGEHGCARKRALVVGGVCGSRGGHAGGVDDGHDGQDAEHGKEGLLCLHEIVCVDTWDDERENLCHARGARREDAAVEDELGEHTDVAEHGWGLMCGLEVGEGRHDAIDELGEHEIGSDAGEQREGDFACARKRLAAGEGALHEERGDGCDELVDLFRREMVCPFCGGCVDVLLFL